MQKSIEQDAIEFLKSFLRRLAKGRLKIGHFGWWKAGTQGSYCLSLSWDDLDEMEKNGHEM